MGRQQANTRLDPDDVERVEEYADERGISKAEAMRRLIRSALDAEEGNATVPADEIRHDLEQLRREVDDDSESVKVYGQIGGKRIATTALGFALLAYGFSGLPAYAALTFAGILGMGLILFGLWPLLERATSADWPGDFGVAKADDAD